MNRWRTFSPLAKVMSAICTAVLAAGYYAIADFVPAGERSPDVYYTPLGYELTVGFLLVFAVSLILFMPLSLLADGLAISLRLYRGLPGLLFMFVAYAAMGAISVVLFSLFVRNLAIAGNAMAYFVSLSLVFLLCQMGVQWLFGRTKKSRRETGTK